MLATANNGMNEENSGNNITEKPASKGDEVLETTGEVASAGVSSPNVDGQASSAGEDGKDATASAAAGKDGSGSSKADPGPRSGDVGPSQGSKGPIVSRGSGSTGKP